METLPVELLDLILEWTIFSSRFEKRTVIPLRLVCRAFDRSLMRYIFKTIRLGFSSFFIDESFRRPSNFLDLSEVGRFTKALCIDIAQGKDTTNNGSMTFTIDDFGRVLKEILKWTPNMHCMRVNFICMYVYHSSCTTTALLAMVFESLMERRWENRALKTLAIDYLDAYSVTDICNKPTYFKNAVRVFSSIQKLCISISQQELLNGHHLTFDHSFWLLLGKSLGFKSLTLDGMSYRFNHRIRSGNLGDRISYDIWSLRPFPFCAEYRCYKFLRLLELKNMEVSPHALLNFFEQIGTSLKELYLFNVFLKVGALGDASSLWIGFPGMVKHRDIVWMAEGLRNIKGLKLGILRVSDLGYDVFLPQQRHEFDLRDPLGLSHTFDQRFFDAYFRGSDDHGP